MWHSEKQQSEVIGELLQRVHLQSFWSENGPTREACELLEAGGGPLSHGQAVLLRVAFDLWNGEGKATVDELITVLDAGNLCVVLEAILTARPDVQLKRAAPAR